MKAPESERRAWRRAMRRWTFVAVDDIDVAETEVWLHTHGHPSEYGAALLRMREEGPQRDRAIRAFGVYMCTQRRDAFLDAITLLGLSLILVGKVEGEPADSEESPPGPGPGVGSVVSPSPCTSAITANAPPARLVAVLSGAAA